MRGLKWICPTGQLIAPHAGAGAPFFGRRQRKGEETACYALDGGTRVTRAREAGVQSGKELGEKPLATRSTRERGDSRVGYGKPIQCNDKSSFYLFIF